MADRGKCTARVNALRWPNTPNTGVIHKQLKQKNTRKKVEITQTKWEPKLTNNCEKENAANVKTPTVKASETHRLKLADFGEAKGVIPDVFPTLGCSLCIIMEKWCSYVARNFDLREFLFISKYHYSVF